MRKKVVSAILCASMVAGMVVIPGVAVKADDKKLIGVTMPTKDLQRWNQDGENMKKELEAAGYEVDLQYASNDVSTQVSQLENQVANGCDLLVVASIDGSSLGEPLKQAKEAGIPVILSDRMMDVDESFRLLLDIPRGDRLPNTKEEWSRFVRPEKIEEIQEKFCRLLASEEEDPSLVLEYELRTGWGEYRWFRVYGCRFPDEKEGYQITGVLTDIHEQRQIKEAKADGIQQLRDRERELESVISKMQQENLDKSRFLTRLSHDIRTPMNVILGYNQLMKSQLTEPKQLDYQKKIEQSGKLLLSIINNVLDMARIESGKMKVDENYERVGEVVDEIISTFASEVEEKGVHLSGSMKVTHRDILCDGTKIREIYVNLVGNAIKYTPRGGNVTITVEELPCKEEGYMKVKSEIKDTGIGMSREYLPTLFEPFSREQNTATGKVRGTGLGMPIVKKMVDLMGGSLEVESELGKGTVFTFTLMHKIADRKYYSQRIEKVKASNMGESLGGKHILLAEDNDLNAEIAVTILEEIGIVIERVEDGIQCVNKVEQMSPGTYDLILMDIQMPNMDGYKAAQCIRHLDDKTKAEIPIIAMTANAFAEDRKRAFDAGMNGHIAKPIDVEKLGAVILSVLKKQESLQTGKNNIRNGY